MRGGIDFEGFESRCISLGHSIIADAMSTALERFDARLCLDLPDRCKVHDRRVKTLPSEVGDLKLRYRSVQEGAASHDEVALDVGQARQAAREEDPGRPEHRGRLQDGRIHR
jgi:hypothetical protein